MQDFVKIVLVRFRGSCLSKNSRADVGLSRQDGTIEIGVPDKTRESDERELDVYHRTISESVNAGALPILLSRN